MSSKLKNLSQINFSLHINLPHFAPFCTFSSSVASFWGGYDYWDHFPSAESTSMCVWNICSSVYCLSVKGSQFQALVITLYCSKVYQKCTSLHTWWALIDPSLHIDMCKLQSVMADSVAGSTVQFRKAYPHPTALIQDLWISEDFELCHSRDWTGPW